MADDPHAGDIVHASLDAFCCRWYATPYHLLQYAPWRLKTRLYISDWIGVVPQRKILVQDIELGLDLHHGAFVICHKFLVWHGRFVDHISYHVRGYNPLKPFLEFSVVVVFHGTYFIKPMIIMTIGSASIAIQSIRCHFFMEPHA